MKVNPILIKGVTISENSIVVTIYMPENQIWDCNPGKFSEH